MRAVYVLVVVLSFVAPQVSRTAIELSRDASASISLAAPSATSHISRAVAKTDKTFSAAGAINTDCVALYPPVGSLDSVAAQTCDVPHLDLEGPPLAPRPPPLS